MRRLKNALCAMLGVLALGAFGIIAPAGAHSWYSDKFDPVTKRGCCGIRDCNKIVLTPKNFTPVQGGFRVRLTKEQAMRINPTRLEAVDIFIPDERVQPSDDGNYHLCIPNYNGATQGDFYCFFEPGIW
jgi:hypothetical protein